MYTGNSGSAKQYDGSKAELCESWKDPQVKWLKRKERQESKALALREAKETMQERT